MAGNVENIKGIGLSVVADASQIRRTFEQAIQGLTNRTVTMTLGVKKDATYDAVLKELRHTKVTIDVALHPTQANIRQIRKDFRTAMDSAGGIPLPITVKMPSQAEGTRIRRAIVRSIGTPEITVVLNPVWGKGGPSAGAFFSRGGAPSAPSGVGAGQGVRQAAAPQAAPSAAGPRGGVATRIKSWRRQEDEAEDAWINRITQGRALLLSRLGTVSSDKSRERLRRAVNFIDKSLGKQVADTPRASASAAGAGETTSTGGKVIHHGLWRGGQMSPGVGTTSSPTEMEKFSREFFQNFAARPRSMPLYVSGDPYAGGTAQAGMNPRSGRIQDPRTGRFIGGRAFQENRGTGVRGQRVQLSFLQPGTEISPEDMERRRVTNLERVTSGRDQLPGDRLIAAMKGLPITFGKEFKEVLGHLQAGNLEGMLGQRRAPGVEGSGVRGMIDSLIASGRIPYGQAGHIQGIGPKTVSNILDRKKGFTGGGPQRPEYISSSGKRVAAETGEQFASRQENELKAAEYELELGMLQDIEAAAVTVQMDRTKEAKKKRITKKQLKANAAARASIPEDTLRDEANAADAEVARLDALLNNRRTGLRSSRTEQTDKRLLRMLTRQPRGASPQVEDELEAHQNRQVGADVGTAADMGYPDTLLNTLRAAAKRQSAAPLTPIEELLPKSVLGKKNLPAGLSAILGGFHAVSAQALPQFTAEGSPRSGTEERTGAALRRRGPGSPLEDSIASLQARLAMSPEELATSLTGPPDKAAIAGLETELAEARKKARSVARRRAAMFKAKSATAAPVEETAAPAQAAAAPGENVVQFPHLAMAGGDMGTGEGGMPFFGGHGGGPVPVQVVNFAELAGIGAVGGSVAAQQTLPSSRDFEKMFQTAQESIEAANAKLGATVGAGKGKGKKAAPAPKTPMLTQSLNRQLQEGLKTGLLTPEDVEEIQARGAPQSAQQVLASQPGAAPAVGGSFQDAFEALRVRMAESRQGLPIRSPAVSIAQSFAGPQRGKVTARLAEAGRLGTQAEGIERDNVKLVDIYETQTRKLAKINALEGDGKKLSREQVALKKSLPGEIDKTTASLKRNVAQQDVLLTKANEMAALTGGEKLANLGRSFAGSIVGTLGYGAALGVVAGAGALAFKALAPLVERSLGYQNVSAAITNNLAEQQKQQGGNVKMLVAQELATKNLTKANAALIAPALAMRAETQAGALSYQQQTEELAAGINVQNAMADNAGLRAQGSRQRYSANPDLYTSSGGLFNTSLFAPQQSTQESIARRINLAAQGIQPGESPKLDPAAFLSDLLGIRSPQPRSPVPSDFKPNMTGMESFQNDVKAAGAGLTAVMGASAADIQATYEALNAADLQEFAKSALEAGISLQGLPKDVDAAAVAVTVLTEQLGKMASRRSVDQLLVGQEDAIKGIRFGINQDLQNQLQTFIPAQRAVQGLAQPQVPFGRSFAPLQGPGQVGQVTGIGGQFGGVPRAVIDTFNQYRQAGQTAIDAINAKITEGEAQMRRLGVPQGQIEELRGFGKAIDDISQQQTNLQLDLQYSQYNRQLFVAKRNLGDIAGLIGRSGGTEIGILQRVDMLLGRQNQKLGFKSQLIGQQANQLQLELSQRQINFQRAIAGFTAPGLTPEERAARIDEAKIEADYAQKQLDFQKAQFDLQKQSYELSKQQFDNSVALQDALNTRSYMDAAAQVAEIEKAFWTQIQVAALEERKAEISTLMGYLVETINAEMGAETQMLKAQAQFQTDLLTQTGDWTVATLNKVTAFFKGITNAMPAWMRNPSTTGTPANQGTSTRTNQGYVNTSPRPNAAGFVGNVSSPTNMLVGEAGTEMVAILRNPRPLPVGLGSGGAGGGGVTIAMPIYISGNTVRDDKDLTELASRVSRMVEVNLGRRASQFGLRQAR